MGKYKSPRERAIQASRVRKIDHFTDMIKNIERQVEYKKRTCDAILLQFDRPLIYDLFIPPPENIYSFMFVAGETISGKKITLPEFWEIMDEEDLYGSFLTENHFSKLSKKVSEGIIHLWDAKDGFSLREYLKQKNIFANEWVDNYGSLYRFRDGEREKAEQRVKGHFNEKELSDFDKIGEVIHTYTEHFFLDS
ncbi:MAG: hypothetical protein M1416_00860 [Candidatus Pacearchaeota archaeon]|nr:hypothetical protein [Candidatus Pacearchaeota archaeon]